MQCQQSKHVLCSEIPISPSFFSRGDTYSDISDYPAPMFAALSWLKLSVVFSFQTSLIVSNDLSATAVSILLTTQSPE